MKTPELVALPHINPERDGVQFNTLAFPQHFDEERILINAGRIKQINRMAGLDGVTVVGTTGPKQEHGIHIGSLGNDGSATVGLGLFKKRREYVQGVRLHLDQTAESDSDGVPQDYFYAPVTIQANVTARDEDLKEKSSLMDAAGHAEFLSKTLSSGLAIAARQRSRYGIVQKLVFVDLVGVGAFTSLMTHNPAYFSALLGLWYAGDLGLGYIESKNRGYPLMDKQYSFAAGLDRALIAQIMARTASLATVAK